MAPKLEVLKGGGGSIRIGTTGTIGTLMSKELDVKCAPRSPIHSKQKVSTTSVLVLDSPKRLQARTLNEASSSRSSNDRQIDGNQKVRRNPQKSNHHMPILTSDDASTETTPSREKTEKRGVNIVAVVDIKCGYPNKWPSPIPNRFKKLNSSKLSDTIG